ncbi:MAG: hypothetical protein IIB03_04560 [Acidobacteria bacterium]|nr:hypothetical protein [Acidobacteriota bacterium]
MNDALTILRPLAFFVLGVAIYSIFIFNFYRFLGRDRFPCRRSLLLHGSSKCNGWDLTTEKKS